MSFERSLILLACACSLSLLCIGAVAADDKGKSKGHGGNGHGGHGHGNHGSNFGSGHGGYNGGGFGGYGGHGQTHVDITPNGVGFGYHGSNFGIHVGPVGGYGNGFGNAGFANGGYYGNSFYTQPPVYYQPIVEPVIVSPPVFVDQQPLYPIAPPVSSTATMPTVPSETTIVARPAIPTPSSGSPTGPTIVEVNERAARYQNQAEQAFFRHDYDEAARSVDHAIIEDGRNGKLHLFASQCRFAVGDYRGAAIGIAEAMSLLEQKDWGWVVKHYNQFYNNDDYVIQMNRLVTYNSENPESAFSSMLRGYHYLYLGHKDAARKQLAKAVDLDSRDTVSQKLLDLAGGGESEHLPAPIPAPVPSDS